MKYKLVSQLCRDNESRPTRGGWIEIHQAVWIAERSGSRPTRGGWIEIR